MKNVLKFIVFALISGLAFNSCEKDTFTEEDAMQALQEVDLIIAVTDKSNFDLPVDSATISTVIDGITVEKTTDATGMVVFENVKIGGNLNVYVSKTNYTKTFTTVSTTPNDYRQATVSATVSIYSLADQNLVTVKGQLTIETDLTNRTKEVVVGTEVRVYNTYLPNGSAKAFVGISDAEGKYEVKVPVNSTGSDYISVRFYSIDAMRTAGVSVNNKYSVETHNAYYDIDGNTNPTDIPAVPSALITIAAPEDPGTGFELTTEVDTSSSYLSVSASSWAILNSGSGYFPSITGSDTTIWAFFSPDTKGLDTARVQLTFEKNGGLVSIDGWSNYGNTSDRNAKYSTKPTINLNFNGGTGAEISFKFKLYYNVKISNHGSGYITMPTIKKTYVIDGVESISTYSLSSYAFINSGSIYSNNISILSTEGRYDNAPTFTVTVDESSQANAFYYSSNLGTDSTLNTSYSWISTGNNYDPGNPPLVTITSLAGYGTGAEFRAEVNSSGVLSNLELINSGKGYARNINDFMSSGTTSNHSGDYGSYSTSTFYNVIPGSTYTVNAYYGTGQITDL
ncbi:MAG TPA: hypothetical protein DCG75_19910 [Bacteroidales bacterium]|nr:hypothetical protein [Bacteroidales bacterium]